MMKLNNSAYLTRAAIIISYVAAIGTALFLLLQLHRHSAQTVHIILNTALMFFPLLLVFTWFNMSMVVSISMSIILAIVTVLITLALSSPIYLVYPLAFALLGFILSRYKEMRRVKNEELKINTEKLKENFNLLINQHEESKGMNKARMKTKQRFLFFKEVAQNLSFTLPQEDLLKRVIEYANLTIGKGDVSLLFLVSKDLVGLELKAFEVISMEKRPLFTDPMDIFNRWVMKNRQPLLVNDVVKDFRFDIDSGGKSSKEVKSLIIAPLLTEGKIIGLLRFDSYKEEAFALDDLRLLSIVANIASTTVKNAMLFRETEELAIKDSLTGLYVKVYFLDELSKHFSIAKSGGGPLSILMLDLDNFKGFNDDHGHTAGDMVLKRYAEVLERNLPKKCVVSRYGGEEFAVIVPGCDPAAAMEIAETLRKRIADQVILIRQEKLKGTTSVGVSTYRPGIRTDEELLRLADTALYEAKKQGKNKVVEAAH